MEARQFSAVTVDNGTKRAIDQIAAATDKSRSRVVRDAIRAYAETAAIRKAMASSEKPSLEVRG